MELQGMAWAPPVAAAAAFVAVACIVGALRDRRERARAVRSAGSGGRDGAAAPPHAARGLDDRLIDFAESTSRKLSLGAARPLARPRSRAAAWCDARMPKAGLAGKVTCAGFCEARLRTALACSACGALAGAVLSTELAVALGLAGACAGWALLSWAVRQRAKARAEELERHLSEMLEVVALGLRSGLSFDRSLQLYTEHFESLLARSAASAQRQWSLGLTTREEALRALAATYDSVLFSRIVENVVRSLRYGSSLAESLEAAAAEARAEYRARKQEQVAKAPVKMMVPTGALMLPAMLLLVLGPVLLELMEGF